jgi:folate-binding protein YgfZ
MAAAGDMLEQYRSVRSGLGWRDLSGRVKIEVTGPDRVEFLHAVLCNDVRSLPDFAGRRGALLTPTGKIVADFDYYRLPDSLMIDVAAGPAARLTELLEGYIIMDDVTLKDVTARFRHWAFEGPRAPEFLRGLLGSPIPEKTRRIVVMDWEGADTWLVRKDLLSDSGFELLVPAAKAAELSTEIAQEGRAFGLAEIGPAAFDILRLERGLPLFGVDFSENNNPLDAQLSDLYSLAKGCYPGQEVLAKATNIGGVARLLIKVRMPGPEVPARGTKLRLQGGKEVGWITSAGFSPFLQRTLGFAFVKRSAATAGTTLAVEMTNGGTVEGEIVESYL